MNTTSDNDTYNATILQGRAIVRLIEAIDVLVTAAAEQEVKELRAIQTRYRQRLRQLVADLPSAVSAQILIASDNIHGPTGEMTLN